jgi:ABC-type multidrug transport system permease subunit
LRQLWFVHQKLLFLQRELTFLQDFSRSRKCFKIKIKFRPSSTVSSSSSSVVSIAASVVAAFVVTAFVVAACVVALSVNLESGNVTCDVESLMKIKKSKKSLRFKPL